MTDKQLSLYSEARAAAAAGSSLSWQINLILLMLPLKQRWGSRGALEVLLQCCTGRSSAGTGLALPRRAGHRSLSIEGNAITTYIIR